MSIIFDMICDDFHIATRLFLKLDLALERETVLHFFDSVKREFPTLRKLRRQDDSSLILEEDEVSDGSRRWLRLDQSAIRLGHHSPVVDLESARHLGDTVLKMAPYHLTLGDLDYDHLEVVYVFDLEYRGNHDQLVADTLHTEGPMAGLLAGEGVVHAIDSQPFIGLAISDACDTQIYVEIKSRTSTFEVRSGQYDPQPLSVFLTARRYWGFSEAESLLDAHHELMRLAHDWAVEKVVPLVVNPLAHAIASRR